MKKQKTRQSSICLFPSLKWKSTLKLVYYIIDLLINYKYATVAQMVEQFTRNDQVSGSIPLGGFR